MTKYLGDYQEDYSTLNTKFFTMNTSEVPTTLAGTPALSVYKANDLTQSTAGITLTADFDSVTGLNNVLIDLSADAFYAVGNDYDIVVTTGTVNSVSWVGRVVASFSIENRSSSLNATALANLENQYDGTGLVGDSYPATQLQLSNIANVGAAVHKTAKPSPNGFTITTGGTETNTEDSTFALDGSYHSIQDSAGALDVYYEFSIGSGVPTSVEFRGYLSSNNDDLDIYGYDWVSASWTQIGNISGTNSSSNEVHIHDMFVDMVGTGSDEGTVRVRFYKASGLTSAELFIDQIFIAFSAGSEGYDNGAVWLDTNFSNTNTEAGIDGVARNPVSTVAALNTLLASTNLHRVMVAPGSSVTFSASQTDEVWIGEDWALALGGQDISGSFFHGASVTGTATSPTKEGHFVDCEIGTVTLGDTHCDRCGIAGTITSGTAASYVFQSCYDNYAQSAWPVFDFGAAIGNTNCSFVDYSGGLDVANYSASGLDTFKISGVGRLTFLGSSSGSAHVKGIWDITNTGGVTITKDDVNDNLDTITDTDGVILGDAGVDKIYDEATSGHNTGGSFGKAIRQIKEGIVSTESTVNDVSATTTSFVTALTEASDTHYADLTMAFIDGNLAGQSRIITTYAGSTKTVTFDEAWSEAPANGDSFIILTVHGHSITQIQSGLATEAKQDLVKAVTDQMVFTKSNELDVNTKSINDAEVTGDGNATPWDGV